MQKILAKHEITGEMSVGLTGNISFDGSASSALQAHFGIHDAGFVSGDYGLLFDRVSCRFSTAANKLTLEEFTIDSLGGHIEIGGGFELDDSRTGSLSFEGADLQIGGLFRGTEKREGRPAFRGLLDFSSDLRGPFSDFDRHAGGQGRLSLRKARLGRQPTLSTIDESLDRAAEAALKRERLGHDRLSLTFSLAGDRARIAKLRMNSRWYGLRGHGDVGFDSRLDMAVTGGPLQRIANELGALGDVMGEISETLVRARVTGTLREPKIGIEVLRQRHR